MVRTFSAGPPPLTTSPSPLYSWKDSRIGSALREATSPALNGKR
jgi:hypothetical protein